MATNNQAVDIFTRYGDFYKPHFVVKQQNRALGNDVVFDVTQVNYRDNLKEFDSFDITLNNAWDLATHSFKHSDEATWDPGSEVELWMGYQNTDQMMLMLKGEITSLRPSFPASGTPTLAVGGHNLLHRFRTRQLSKTYDNKRDSQIAEFVVARLRSELNIDLQLETDQAASSQEVPHPHIVQENQYDILFLLERARHAGYDLFIKEQGSGGRAGTTELYFGPSMGIKRTTYRLKYGESLINFTPTFSTANQVESVKVRGWDNVRKQMIEVQVNRREAAVNRTVGSVRGRNVVDQSVQNRQEVVVDVPMMSEMEARRLANSTIERIMKNVMKGAGSCIGLPDMRAGTIVYLEGLGERFSGRYFITASTHSISDAGYTTQFECERQELSL